MAARQRPADPRISVVVPARNEARNLCEVIPLIPREYEVVVVDGSSRDGTRPVARRLRTSATVISQTRRGKGNALVCGFEAATGDIVVMLDADGSADVREIPAFVEALVAGADFAKGSRFLPTGGSEDLTKLRALGNHALTGTANLLFGTSYTDLCYGYNAFWRDILPALDLPDAQPEGDEMLWGDGFEIETVLNTRVAAAGLKVVEVPSVEALRLHGASNLHAVKDGIRVARTLLTEKRRARALPTTSRTAAGTAVIPAQRQPAASESGILDVAG
ncbi:glycosyltransferase family 2 protein [Nakamurella alba]|uniref:glycosyltransferase family 2 protein n=1 Tax=Nakamurella alba TaxID=2665158 RepID=UPI002AC35C6D|nr:glycosyltransferase family 2 protein [Nakamurella alba]